MLPHHPVIEIYMLHFFGYAHSVVDDFFFLIDRIISTNNEKALVQEYHKHIKHHSEIISVLFVCKNEISDCKLYEIKNISEKVFIFVIIKRKMQLHAGEHKI